MFGSLMTYCKEVLYLQYYNELGSKEIGEILSIKPDNVRKIASRARKILKEKYTIQGAVSKQKLIKMLENRERIG